MIDLTPLEVRQKKGDFRQKLRGYDSEQVDDFLDLVATRLEELVRENVGLSDRLRLLETQVAEYRDRDRAMTEALVTAQEMREELRKQAAREAEIVKRESESHSDTLRRDAETYAESLRREAEVYAENLRREVESEASAIRAGAMQVREREEEEMRRLRARRVKLLQTFRTFLERELAELAMAEEEMAELIAEPSEPARRGGRSAGAAAFAATQAPSAERVPFAEIESEAEEAGAGDVEIFEEHEIYEEEILVGAPKLDDTSRAAFDPFDEHPEATSELDLGAEEAVGVGAEEVEAPEAEGPLPNIPSLELPEDRWATADDEAEGASPLTPPADVEVERAQDEEGKPRRKPGEEEMDWLSSLLEEDT